MCARVHECVQGIFVKEVELGLNLEKYGGLDEWEDNPQSRENCEQWCTLGWEQPFWLGIKV